MTEDITKWDAEKLDELGLWRAAELDLEIDELGLGDEIPEHGVNTDFEHVAATSGVLGLMGLRAPRKLTEAQLQSSWAPACRGPWVTMTLYGGGKVTIRPAAVDMFVAFNKVLIKHKYRARKKDTSAYNCRKKTGSRTQVSRHSEGGTIDLNWTTNPFSRRLITDMPKAMRDDIKAIRTNNGKQCFTWGGDWDGNRDAMHYQPGCRLSDLAHGIDYNTVPSNVTPIKPKPKPPTPAKPKPPTPAKPKPRPAWSNDMDIYESPDGSDIVFDGFEWMNEGPNGGDKWRFLGVPSRKATQKEIDDRIKTYKLDRRVPRDHK